MAATFGVMVTLVTTGFGAYGWLLFVGLPFFLGWLAAAVSRPRTFWSAMGIATGAVVVCGAGLIFVGAEGGICLLMALPIALGPALLGGLAAWLVGRMSGPSVRAPWVPVLLIFAVASPPLLATEARRTASAPLHQVVTSLEIDAPPERVWRHIVTFSELPPPSEWIFRAGVAWPVRARIEGTGVGAVRYCEFSTGPFVEPITVWNEPHHLAFDVTRSPEPMRELNPFWNVRPPHLEGYLASERGEFRLVALPGGRTRLVGTTWYRHHMYPDVYWQAWSDFVIHRIHGRVLRHIKALAER
jgi:hypothetical protein